MSEVESRQSLANKNTQRRKWRPTMLVWLTTICGLLGSSVLIYPTASAWVFQYNQAGIIKGYTESIKNVTPNAHEQLLNAYEYNKALSSGALLEANTNKPSGAGTLAVDGITPYTDQLKVPAGIMARIKVPSAGVDLPIYHGTSDETLLRGLGHLEGTSLPVGGTSTHAVITGHRGLANATMFTHLDRVKVGDTFTIEVMDEVLVYQVYETKVVEPTDTKTLRQIPGADVVTLITCTPLGVNSHRILVTAERITPTPIEAIADAGNDSLLPHFPWWIVIYVGALALVGTYLWRAGHVPQKRDAETGSESTGIGVSIPTGQYSDKFEESDPTSSYISKNDSDSDQEQYQLGPSARDEIDTSALTRKKLYHS